MPDYPPEVIQRAAEVRLRRYESEYQAAHLTWRDFADEAREVLDVVAEQLGQHVAAKIYEHRDNYGDRMADPARRRARRRDFGIAAQVAAQAFLAEDDLKAIAARELAAGRAVICTGPEVPEDSDA